MRTFSQVFLCGVLVWCGLGVAAAHAEPFIADPGRPMYQFSPKEKWNVWWNPKHGQPRFEQQRTDEGFVVTVGPLEKNRGIAVYSSPAKRPQMAINRPNRITLDIDLLEGEGVSVALAMRDEQDETFLLTKRKLQPGLNTVTWDWDKDIARQWGDGGNGEVDGRLKLWQFYLLVPKSNRDTKVRFKSSSSQSDLDNPLDLLDVRLDTGDPLYIIRPGEESQARIVIHNTGGLSQTVDLDGVLRGWGDARASVTRSSLTVPARGSVEVSLADSLPARGGIMIDWTLRSGEWSREGLLSAAYVDPPGPQSADQPFQVGMCMPYGDPKWLRGAALAGARYARTGADLRRNWPEPDALDTASLEQKISNIEAAGMEPQLLIAYGIPWMTPEKYWQYETAPDGTKKRITKWPLGYTFPPRLEPWAQWCREIASRFGDRVRYYEVWNEPDIGFYRGTTEEYLGLLRTAYEEIHAVDSDALVGTGGFAGSPYGVRKSRQFLHPGIQMRVLEEASDSFDIWFTHYHAKADGLVERLRGEILPLKKRLGLTQSVIFNETGYTTTADPANEPEQAIQLVQKMAYAWAGGADGCYWFCMWRSPNRSKKEYGYNLFSGQYDTARPKPAYAALATLSGLWRGIDSARLLDSPPEIALTSFTGPDKTLICVWSWSDDSLPIAMTIDAGADLELLDLMGNPLPLHREGDRVYLTLGRAPVYLSSTSVITPSIENELVRIDGPVLLATGRSMPMRVSLADPASDRAKVPWTLAAAEGRVLASGTAELSNGLGEVAIDLALPASRRDSAAYETLTFRADFGDGRVFESVTRPIIATMLPAMSAEGREPDFVLDDEAQLVDLTAADPTRESERWRGPNDLSAKAWVVREADALKVIVDVTDDRHKAVMDSGELWRGDSVQFAIVRDSKKGFWEFTLAAVNGRAVSRVTHRPDDQRESKLEPRTAVEALPRGWRYTFLLPDVEFGFDREALRTGLRLNLLINDNDGNGRGGWLQMAPGIGGSKSSRQFPLVIAE